MKKLIISITIISFMNLVGCYYQEQMSPDNFNFSDAENVQITTEDTTYNLSGKDYYYDNDTVFATKRIKLDAQSTMKMNIEIPVETIEMIEVKKMDTFDTALTIGVITLVLVALVALLGSDGWGG